MRRLHRWVGEARRGRIRLGFGLFVTSQRRHLDEIDRVFRYGVMAGHELERIEQGIDPLPRHLHAVQEVILSWPLLLPMHP